MKRLFCIFLFFNLTFVASQTYKGVILDLKTNEPIPFVTVYFKGTSIGTTSNINGSYTITKPENIETSLIYRIIGYETQSIQNPNESNTKVIRMKVTVGDLDAILLESDLSWSRAIKIKEFKKYFLGETKYVRGSKILNLSKVRLRFNPSTKKLTAYCNEPIIIENNYLGYKIKYDLADFEVQYDLINNEQTTASGNGYNISSKKDSNKDYYAKNAFLNGSAFFEDMELDSRKKERALERRQKLYESSEVFLIKSIVKGQMNLNQFYLIYDRKKRNPENDIKVFNKETYYKVYLREKEYKIIDRFKNKSLIIINEPFIEVSPYFHVISAGSITYGGFLGKLKVTGILPLDYISQESLLD